MKSIDGYWLSTMREIEYSDQIRMLIVRISTIQFRWYWKNRKNESLMLSHISWLSLLSYRYAVHSNNIYHEPYRNIICELHEIVPLLALTSRTAFLKNNKKSTGENIRIFSPMYFSWWGYWKLLVDITSIFQDIRKYMQIL